MRSCSLVVPARFDAQTKTQTLASVFEKVSLPGVTGYIEQLMERFENEDHKDMEQDEVIHLRQESVNQVCTFPLSLAALESVCARRRVSECKTRYLVL